MKRSVFALAFAFSAMFAAPSSALTFPELQDIVGDDHCAGSFCTSEDPGSRTETFETKVRDAVSEGASYPDQTSPAADYKKGGWFNARCGGIGYYNSDCTALSIAPTSGGFPAVYRTDSRTIGTCVTTVRRIDVDTSVPGSPSFSLTTTSESSADGSC